MLEAIAVLLLIAAGVKRLAAVLFTALPDSAPEPMRRRAAAEAARIVVEVPDTPASRTELLNRAAYSVTASKRLLTALQKDEDFRVALDRELGYLELHRRAVRRRSGAREEVREVAGGDAEAPLVWRAKLDTKTDPLCRRLHGTRFTLRDPPREGLPGTLHAGFCRCRATRDRS